jgi:hypothetical protein
VGHGGRRSGWTSWLSLVFALAFGVFSPYQAAPREAESEEVEAWGDRAEAEESAHARVAARHNRRAHRPGGASASEVTFASVPARFTTAVGEVPRPRWLRPRRNPPPDDAPLA